MKRLYLILMIMMAGHMEGAILADLSFVVIDLKYNEEDGVKICEMQEGYGSFFEGAEFLDGNSQIVAERLCDYFHQFHDYGWVLSPGICRYFMPTFETQKNWHISNQLGNFKGEHKFPSKAKFTPKDPSVIANYQGLFLSRKRTFDPIKFLKKYPGLLLVNRALMSNLGESTFSDKFTMSMAFRGDPQLENLKPKWVLYPKEYGSHLVNRILEDFSTEYLVIKPRAAFGGSGVIILHRDDLDSTLQYIFGNSIELKGNPDKSYHHWATDSFPDFLVEEFFASVEVTAPHLSTDHYDPTMRVIVALSFNDGVIDIECLYSFWKLPKMGLDEEGTLNERHKSFSLSKSHYVAVTPEIHEKVTEQLTCALPLLYTRLLG